MVSAPPMSLPRIDSASTASLMDLYQSCAPNWLVTSVEAVCSRAASTLRMMDAVVVLISVVKKSSSTSRSTRFRFFSSL